MVPTVIIQATKHWTPSAQGFRGREWVGGSSVGITACLVQIARWDLRISGESNRRLAIPSSQALGCYEEKESAIACCVDKQGRCLVWLDALYIDLAVQAGIASAKMKRALPRNPAKTSPTLSLIGLDLVCTHCTATELRWRATSAQIR